MGNGIAILAAKTSFSFFDTRVLIATGLLAGILFLGAAVIALVANWRRRQENATYSMHDQLASFRTLYEQGQMSAEEFARVKAQLLGQYKKTVGTIGPPVPKPKPGAITPEPPPPPPPPTDGPTNT